MRASRIAKIAGSLLVFAIACGPSEVEPARGAEVVPAAAEAGAPLPSAAPEGAIATTDVVFVPGDGISPMARARLRELLTRARGAPVLEVDGASLASLPEEALVIAVGASSVSRAVVSDAEVSALSPEGYVVRGRAIEGRTVLVAEGRPAGEHPVGNLGALHGAYALLAELGFAFLHPLAPVVPTAIALPGPLPDRTASPRWDFRALHLHTQHPLELTELLEGFGPNGPTDAEGFAAMLPEWDRFLEWSVANGQNGVEWFLLWAESWSNFADSDARRARLTTLVEHAHGFGLNVGIDAPIAFAQQHAFRLLRTQRADDLEGELAEIRGRLDWIFGAGFDWIGIESGTSEFTHPDPARMLAWMNEVAKHAVEQHGARAFIKVHCSTGQAAEGYPDPVTGEPIDFNQLPHYADPRLGVLPHTVQHYGLLDAAASTYGNAGFAHVRDFLRREAGSRPVVFYPETAYWVSFDVDVPLFLPLYAERRLSDLRLLARDEAADPAGRRMDGQLVFSSGWEWGYWLNDVVAARAAWNPESDAESDADAFARALAPVSRAFGGVGPEVARWIGDVVAAEKSLVVEGRVSNVPPSTIDRRNGQAYLQGFDAWDDVSEHAAGLGIAGATMTQPRKLGLVEMRNPFHGGPGYSAEVEPLLAAMETTFAELAARGDALRPLVPTATRELFDDLADAMQMTALRARQVHGLYDYVDGYWTAPEAARLARLGAARSALDAAHTVVLGREPHYRVPAERISAWRPNPTAYAFGYLWSVRSLYYFWRDEGKAVDHPLSPCYLNVINPVDVAFGEGMGTTAARFFGDVLGSGDRGCLAEPASEPTFPQDGLRTRPL